MAKVTTKVVREWIAGARSVCSGGDAPAAWWPESQAERTVLAQAIALQWADHDKLGWDAQHQVWVSTCWCRETIRQRAVLEAHGIALPRKGDDYSKSNANRRLDAHQFMVDFSIWPTDASCSAEHVHLVMESEMYPEHGVGSEVHPENGYAYDFYKVAWVPSPRRVFVCAVNGGTVGRVDQVAASLSKVANESAKHIGDCWLATIILPTALSAFERGAIGLWTGRRLEWEPVGGAS